MEENTVQNTASDKQNSMKWVGLFVVLLLIVGGIFVVVSQQTTKTKTDAKQVTENQSVDTTTNAETVLEDEETNNVKEFKVAGSSFKFDLVEIKVKKGDTVRIIFTSSGGVHDWVIDEFNARTQQLQSAETETIEFVADKIGTFEYYCSVGQHRQMGMVGNLIVE